MESVSRSIRVNRFLVNVDVVALTITWNFVDTQFTESKDRLVFFGKMRIRATFTREQRVDVETADAARNVSVE